MDGSDLFSIKSAIEGMNKFHQVAVLRILRESETVTLNENKNGVFVNLTELSGDKVAELEEYVKYVAMQEDQLSELEDKKEQFMSDFYGHAKVPVGNRRQITLTGDANSGGNKDKDNSCKNVKVADAV
jgi:hypothetical protein